MSAWIVSKQHIDTLVTAALAWELAVIEQADEIGRMLWQENLNSIHARYPDTIAGGEYPGPIGFLPSDVEDYRFELVPGRVDPEVVHVAARCYRYQSCEHGDWNTSHARAWNETLLERALSLSDRYRDQYGEVDENLLAHRDYASGTGVGAWGIDSREVFYYAAAERLAAQGVSA